MPAGRLITVIPTRPSSRTTGEAAEVTVFSSRREWLAGWPVISRRGVARAEFGVHSVNLYGHGIRSTHTVPSGNRGICMLGLLPLIGR